MKTEAASIPHGAHMPALNGGTKTAGGIFHHPEAMSPCDCVDRLHLGSQTKEVHRQNRFGARRDQRFNASGINVETRQVDVGKHHLAAQVLHHIGRRDPGEAGTIASSPGPKPNAANDKCKAVVQLVTAILCSAPVNAHQACSNSRTLGPGTNQPPRSGSHAQDFRF